MFLCFYVFIAVSSTGSVLNFSLYCIIEYNILQDLQSAADSIMRSKSFPKLIQSFETFVLKLADMSDEMMQV